MTERIDFYGSDHTEKSSTPVCTMAHTTCGGFYEFQIRTRE